MPVCYQGPPRLPVFNILCNLWQGVGVAPQVGPPNIANLPCQLCFGEYASFSGLFRTMLLKVPTGTDIHFARPFPAVGTDVVECPAGSQRWYTVSFVDDVGRGFPNTWRFALLLSVPPYLAPLP